MKLQVPSAEEYSAQTARYAGLSVVDISTLQQAVRVPYMNDVLANVNGDCMRMAVFEGEYRWHRHLDSDELFLVVEGLLQIDLVDGATIELGPWQLIVVPAGTVHRTRAIGRVVNVTFEKQNAKTEFLAFDPSTQAPSPVAGSENQT